MSKSYHWLMLLLTLLAAVGTTLGLFVQVRPKKLQLTASVTSAEELTSKHIPDLTVYSSYKGKTVERLWKVIVVVRNSGDKTLIGTGPQTNLIGDSVRLLFQDWAKIIEAGNITDEPSAEVRYDKDGNKVWIKFEQWRPGETLEN